ncbi:hypothetical protein EVA_03740 [gut metagenome]|uniref:Uncharacterized protein n=1 Tax=gut metagenome TaxID=749906 RepID=J9GK64_9ZZZZ
MANGHTSIIYKGAMRTKVALLLFHTPKVQLHFLRSRRLLGNSPKWLCQNVDSSIKPKDNFNPKKICTGNP